MWFIRSDGPTADSAAGARHRMADWRHNTAMVQKEPAWAFEHSVDCEVTVEFAWAFWTDVNNWALDSDVESVQIDGPFAAGTHGSTNSKSSGRIEWRIAEADGHRAVIEFPLSDAVGRCVWTFEDRAGCTRITQCWMLQGEQAASYAKVAAPSLMIGIPAGMRKLCRMMEDAAQFDRPSTAAN